ncbi:MAG: transcriptional regulator [Gimesia sp.]|jgi:nitrogen regulatory protein PII|uniref:P-II family nitrogen regulator n=2 Tax=Gimesia TaxID=1649453 RepID=A0A6I6AJG8_9PLAN|nr:MULTISPECIES: P-II family nitrogen regulator [Gimesia]HAW29124.1 P-II family nitrogen regulator [Planctomycetaceae bacterium]MAX36640.1 transcriptional regulator [Gimesia sp.]MBN73563.1 transcriptional regulator [Gimesia sp.]QDT23487.1 Nitrogen regulatory protein P-II 1 [Gimesia chilikensis]QGQ25712.1 P-II family nitrogen regulator [Gimesia benthica]|tara:strand:- start:3511 stop:3783 length:273 start_codon:yes stop_codon:yes gene_type:complete
MKEVKAVFQPFMPKPVLEALQKVDHLPAATETEVDGYSVVHPDYTPKPKIILEFMVPDDIVDAIVQALQSGAHTGNLGDGCIFVIEVKLP